MAPFSLVEALATREVAVDALRPATLEVLEEALAGNQPFHLPVLALEQDQAETPDSGPMRMERFLVRVVQSLHCRVVKMAAEAWAARVEDTSHPVRMVLPRKQNVPEAIVEE